jgi:hypothetical protein|tara:strand:+ start:59 stop:325 length:267 start_codon:yes stop_codon:yes gene_type:complete
MMNFLESDFFTIAPLASIFCSILFIANGNAGVFMLSGLLISLVAVILFILSGVLFYHFGIRPTIEIELDTLQLGSIQLATMLFILNTL